MLKKSLERYLPRHSLPAASRAFGHSDCRVAEGSAGGAGALGIATESPVIAQSEYLQSQAHRRAFAEAHIAGTGRSFAVPLWQLLMMEKSPNGSACTPKLRRPCPAAMYSSDWHFVQTADRAQSNSTRRRPA